MQSYHWVILGYLIGLVTAITWGHIEKWAYRDPQDKASNVLLILMGWFMVPIALIGFIGHAFIKWFIKPFVKKT